ncbi:MAG: 50S ribosomal protein L10 [Candidatus Latescibacteria bacterium]|nr:50S ribosomal protein L10 [Candidatus Latescibacterota bacterium]
MERTRKVQLVEEYIGMFDKPGVYLMDFTGLNVAEMTQLRRQLREASVSMRVVKNTLAKRALDQLGIAVLDDYIVGPIGVVWSQEDPVSPARVLLKFIGDKQKGSVRVGIVDGALVTEDDIKTISKLPTKNELRAKLAMTLNMPMVKLARVFNALPTKFARTVKALEEKKGRDE